MFDDITEKHREIEKIIKQVKQMKGALNNGVY